MDEKLIPALVVLALLVIALVLMGLGWRNRRKRQAALDVVPVAPAEIGEEMARVKVLLRRAAHVAESSDDVHIAGPLRLDGIRLSASWHGSAVPLTVTEFLLLQTLARRPGAVRTRDHLMDSAYPDRTHVSDRTIDSHVKRIRRKFLAIDPAFAAIEGVYGAGYRYRAEPA